MTAIAETSPEGEMPDFVCPVCRLPIALEGGSYACAPCDRVFPVVFGIPDFRVADDPYITIEDDRAKGLRIAEEAGQKAGTSDLRELLEFYWSITPEVEPERAAKYVNTVLASGMRGADLFDWALESETLAAAASAGTPAASASSILEIGCGAGGLLAEIQDRLCGPDAGPGAGPDAGQNVGSGVGPSTGPSTGPKAGSGTLVMGVDRAFRWLVVAKLWLGASGRRVPLVCANADRLPFAPGTFDWVIAESVLEHNDGGQSEIVCEVSRVLSEEGCFIASTPNRLAPLPDPHMGVWGLGLFPASWRVGIVRAVKRQPYRFIELIGPSRLRRLCRGAGLHEVSLAPARFGSRMRARFGPPGRLALGVYGLLWTFAPTRMILAWMGPILWIRARRNGR